MCSMLKKTARFCLLFVCAQSAYAHRLCNYNNTAAIIDADGGFAVLKFAANKVLNKPITCGMLGEFGFSKNGDIAYFRDAIKDEITIVDIIHEHSFTVPGIWLELSRDGRIVCVQQEIDEHLHQTLFDTTDGSLIASMPGCRVIVSPQIPVMLVYDKNFPEHSPTVVNMTTGRKIGSLRGKPHTFSHDGKFVATQQSDGFGTPLVTIYSLETGSVDKMFVGIVEKVVPGVPVVERQS